MQLLDRLSVLRGNAGKVFEAMAYLPVTMNGVNAVDLSQDLGMRANAVHMAFKVLILAGLVDRVDHGLYEVSPVGRQWWWYSRELFDGVSERDQGGGGAS